MANEELGCEEHNKAGERGVGAARRRETADGEG